MMSNKKELWQAIANADLTKVKRLIEEEQVIQDINEYYNGKTLLHELILNDRADNDLSSYPEEQKKPDFAGLAEYLIEKGADPKLTIQPSNNSTEIYHGKSRLELLQQWQRMPWIQRIGFIDRASYQYTAEHSYNFFQKRFPDEVPEISNTSCTIL